MRNQETYVEAREETRENAARAMVPADPLTLVSAAEAAAADALRQRDEAHQQMLSADAGWADAEERALSAAKTLEAARAGFDSAMAAVVAERDEVIRQRDEALGRVGATVAVLDEERWRADQQQQRAEAAEKRAAEAHAEIDALDRALSAAGLPSAETLAGRVAGLQLTRAEALGEARALTTERDNCREVLRREREERAAEKATIGEALAVQRAETDELGESVDSLRAENERLAAQLEFAERVLIAGIRRAVP